ncbi:hypothetical protein A2853_00010 [Candidatus Kaiserbacteria bacterium RIFCSPHIGHO2_01_FULL_55_17]|uniref:Uncharacterized protein n=1 Tax=Candidatus Kaiserbacteria bacterium RIFCSPHIGHO2_01_FULL_55_17 TaxID=1798484 RepID=A0A1F6DAF3_9BACT|nr:MAG: hypothetical protein A2853_00010 [Candidatus Kaiserbacteria bacterium RIFCSPHIGHO2_01_FULL_55_17]
MGGLSTTTLVGTIVVLTLIAGLLLAFAENKREQYVLSVTNFDECAAAGFPIMESYPEQCRTSDGRTFVNERQVAPGGEQGLGLQANGCAVAGCSGQLCVSADEAGNIMTTCEYRAEYACYQEASCEPQAGGKCGWTMTPALQRCLANPPADETSLPQAY